MDLAEGLLSEIDQRQLDESVFRVVKTNRILNECKTLDSLHLATALIFMYSIDEPIEILGYDSNMNKVGKKLGFIIGATEKECF